MAVSKLWAVNSRLGQVIDYAANPEKTAADIYSEEQYQAQKIMKDKRYRYGERRTLPYCVG